MKFSEALLAGSKKIEARNSWGFGWRTPGCALMMVREGLAAEDPALPAGPRECYQPILYLLFPWLQQQIKCPRCECWASVDHAIQCMFARAVWHGWSMRRKIRGIAEWVRDNFEQPAPPPPAPQPPVVLTMLLRCTEAEGSAVSEEEEVLA